MTPPRLNRLLAPDGRCAIAMVDHGQFGEPAWLDNRPDIERLVTEHAEGELDAISLPAGSAAALQALPGARKPALILRGDICDLWIAAHSGPATSRPLGGVVDRALRLDAACVVTTILQVSSHPHLHTESLRTVDAIRAASDRHRLPVMIEIVALTERDGALANVDDVATVATLCRQAAELGADVVKTEPTASASDYGAVVAAAGGLPVVAGSGAKAPDEEILERTAVLIAAGAAGVAYGGNILRAPDPVAMSRAVSRVVHSGSPQDRSEHAGRGTS